MARKDGKIQEETVRIRLSTGLLNRCRAMQEPSGWGSEAETSFLRHLIEIGIKQKEFEDRKQKAVEEAQIEEALRLAREEDSKELLSKGIEGHGGGESVQDENALIIEFERLLEEYKDLDSHWDISLGLVERQDYPFLISFLKAQIVAIKEKDIQEDEEAKDGS
jgi:hypothetical protein